MSKADDMFGKLGYEKKETMIGEIYKNKRKCVDMYFIRPDELIEVGFYGDERQYLSMQELKAINKKIEELGWEE